MGPPARVPGRPNVLRKSRSTNTLRLPKREEGKKPGYCESCRIRFDDFKLVRIRFPRLSQTQLQLFLQHVTSRKHRKFAVDDGNFLQLDFLLERVRRKTVKEAEEEQLAHEARLANIDYDISQEDYSPESSDELQFLPLAPGLEHTWDSEGEDDSVG
jgi:regulatory subunit for Cdc7p protein kinase